MHSATHQLPHVGCKIRVLLLVGWLNQISDAVDVMLMHDPLRKSGTQARFTAAPMRCCVGL